MPYKFCSRFPIGAFSEKCAPFLAFFAPSAILYTIQKDGTLYASFEFNADASLMMALCAGLSRIDVFDLNDGCRLLFSIHVPAELGGDTFTDMRFSKDGAYAVGMTASGKCVIGDLFADADALIARTRAFAAGK